MLKWPSEFLSAQRIQAGCLGDHIEAFANALTGRGYAQSTVKGQVRFAAELGLWLEKTGVRVVQFDERYGSKFLAHLRRRGRAARSHRTTVRLLLGFLRAANAIRPIARDSSIDANPIVQIERAFRKHLSDERGLKISTCSSYGVVAQRLLARRFHSGAVVLSMLGANDVTQFIAREARTRPLSMQVIVPALRSFLRWLYQRGDTEVNLAGCVPAVAQWHLATVPRSLPAEDVERLLQHCVRATVVGRRDYAVLLLLARLGLRAGEVVAMELDDFDWEHGVLLVRSKGGRQDGLPLPRDVGFAVAAYLRNGRPNCLSRRVFVRVRAPHQGFVSSVAICDIVKRGLKRAGLKPSRKGAHTLRHALACTMLHYGASLAEIGQILRHRSPDTTAIYAKVDLESLRALAPQWPDVGGDT